jgi:hypothetical protein
MTRNVTITLTDLAYEVWREIPHGLRSKVVSDFLAKNVASLTQLERPKEKEKSITESIFSLSNSEDEE